VKLAELVDLLLTQPNVITGIQFFGAKVTDEIGIKLARFVAVSTTINTLILEETKIKRATRLAMADALRTNTSLRVLRIAKRVMKFMDVDEASIDSAFVEALRLNPNRPDNSEWWVHRFCRDDFCRLKAKAESPSL
jgi:hypothetical protein